VATTRPDSLSSWLAHLEQVHPRGIDMGLARVSAVADRLAVRPPAPLCFVVGGTNGKGSTTTAIEHILRARGLRTGATFSPHLVRFNERIRLDGDEVTDALLCAAFDAIETARAEITLTYFEFGMLAALWCFREARVDAAVIEVGLGGRLDAANIVDADVAVITTIGLDHMEYLGPDRPSIAREKAHIARQGRPLVVGEPDPPDSLLEVAAHIGARVIRRGDAAGEFAISATPDGFEYRGPSGTRRCTVRTPLILDNVGTALAALEAASVLPDERTLSRALAGARIAGRIQRVDARVPVHVDVAHNPHGAHFLAAAMSEPSRQVAGQTHLVLGTLADKDRAGIVAGLAPLASRWWLATTRGERGLAAEVLADTVRADAGNRPGVGDNATVSVHADLAMALGAALAAAGAGDRILVCGCFQVAADALDALGAAR
jgi:dihydrofolate synthase/folylpolyglutamate synthase